MYYVGILCNKKYLSGSKFVKYNKFSLQKDNNESSSDEIKPPPLTPLIPSFSSNMSIHIHLSLYGARQIINDGPLQVFHLLT